MGDEVVELIVIWSLNLGVLSSNPAADEKSIGGKIIVTFTAYVGAAMVGSKFSVPFFESGRGGKTLELWSLSPPI